MSRDITFDELSILHSKSVEDSSKTTNVTKQVEFESTTIKKFSDQEHFKALDDIEKYHQAQPQQHQSESMDKFD